MTAPNERQANVLESSHRPAGKSVSLPEAEVREVGRESRGKHLAIRLLRGLSRRAQGLDGFLNRLLEAALEITGSPWGEVHLLSSDGLDVRLAAMRGFSPAYAQSIAKICGGEGAVREALLTGRRVVVADLTESPLYSGKRVLWLLLGEGCRATQATPLVAGDGRILGAISTQGDAAGPLKPRVGRLLDLLAREGADAIERLQTEEKLRSSRLQLDGIVSSAMDAIISVDANDRIILFNRAAERVFRCGAAEAMGGRMDRFIPARYREQHAAHMKKFASAGDPGRQAGRLETLCGLRADGEEFPMEVTISRYESGGEQAFTVILRDITRRLREEAAMRRQAELLNLSHDAIFTWSAAGGVEFWNAGATQLYGHQPREARGVMPHLLLGTVFPVPWPEIEAELFKSGQWEGELRRRSKSGREVVVAARLQLVSGNDGVILESDRDITGRRKLEQELIEISSAEQHRIGQALGDGLCRQLAAIDREASRLKEVTDLDPSPGRGITDIRGLIRDAICQVRLLAHGLSPVPAGADGLMGALEELTRTVSSIDCVCRFECPHPVRLDDSAAATQLFRIAQEAVSNAVRHGRGTEIVIALHGGVALTRLSVSDNGRGFEPGKVRDSLGTGLRMMRHRAGMMGATLKIKTGQDIGSSVICTLRGSR